MRGIKGSFAFVLGFSFLAGCGGEKPKLVPPKSEAVETACGHGADNDGDGHRDCDDLDCRVAGQGCALAPPLTRSVATTVPETVTPAAPRSPSRAPRPARSVVTPSKPTPKATATADAVEERLRRLEKSLELEQ